MEEYEKHVVKTNCRFRKGKELNIVTRIGGEQEVVVKYYHKGNKRERKFNIDDISEADNLYSSI